MLKFGNVFKLKGLNGFFIGIVPFFMMLFLALMSTTSNLQAMNIPVGNNDLSLRLDNTVRYTLMNRVSDQHPDFLNSANIDDGERNFDKGIVSNRMDLLTELDFVYRRTMGVRVSGAFWYDQAYHEDFDNDSLGTSNYFNDDGYQAVGGLYDHAEDYYAGPYGELLDAFIFTKFEVRNIPVFLKMGRHIYSWGQAMLHPFHGISYGQMPLDMAKGAAQPGVEVKELFRPTNSVSAVMQLTSEFQLATQYFLEWEGNKLPLEGTFLAQADASLHGKGTMLQFGGAIQHGRDYEPDDTGDFGVGLQWTPQKMFNTTFGFYYRKFSDRMPTLIIDTNGDIGLNPNNVGFPSFNPNNWLYHVAYKSDIDLYGVSYASTLFGMSVGAEISYRNDMPLLSGPTFVTSSDELPEDGEILGATGETLQVVFNFMNLLKKSNFWDSGNWVMEFAYSRWLDVTDDPQKKFKGLDGYDTIDRVTKDALSGVLMFTPSYYQIFPGLDLDIPLTVNYGVYGVSPLAGGSGEGDGSVSIGLNFKYLAKYRINFSYTNYFGEHEMTDSMGAVGKGAYALYKDKDFVSLTVKYSF